MDAAIRMRLKMYAFFAIESSEYLILNFACVLSWAMNIYLVIED